MIALKDEIERFASARELDADAGKIFLDFRDQLTRGLIRAAEKKNGKWQVNAWVN